MFSFFKKKSKHTFSDFGFIHTDIHSHLLPGIDDGAKDMEDALQLVEGLMEIGFKRLITTPHIYQEYYPNTSEIIRNKGEELKQAIKIKGWDIEICYAAEYFMDEHFEKLLEQEDILTLSNNHLLFELPFFDAPPQLENVIFQMTLKGYRPILAHPERYTYWFKKESKYQRLKDMGCKFQLNLLSLLGHYGPEVKKNAEWLIKQKMVDLVGTDLHNKNHLKGLNKLLTEKGKALSLLNNADLLNSKLIGQQIK